MSNGKERNPSSNAKWAPERKAKAFEHICEQISLGKSLRAICQAADMPSRVAFSEWIKADRRLAQQYAFARQLQADFYVDEIIEIADNARDHRRARLQIDARKWLASKLMLKSYGDRIARSCKVRPWPVSEKPAISRAESARSMH